MSLENPEENLCSNRNDDGEHILVPLQEPPDVESCAVCDKPQQRVQKCLICKNWICPKCWRFPKWLLNKTLIFL